LDSGETWDRKYLIPRINGREGALEFGRFLLSSSTAKEIFISILYERSVVVTSSELVGIVA
jgi:hypothetical protein